MEDPTAANLREVGNHAGCRISDPRSKFLLHSASAQRNVCRVPSTNLTFEPRDAHRAWLATHAALPAGFRVGTTRFEFMPKEAPKPAKMTLTLLALDQPSTAFAAMFS